MSTPEPARFCSRAGCQTCPNASRQLQCNAAAAIMPAYAGACCGLDCAMLHRRQRTASGRGRSKRMRPGRRMRRPRGCTSSCTSAALAPGSSTRILSSCYLPRTCSGFLQCLLSFCALSVHTTQVQNKHTEMLSPNRSKGTRNRACLLSRSQQRDVPTGLSPLGVRDGMPHPVGGCQACVCNSRSDGAWRAGALGCEAVAGMPQAGSPHARPRSTSVPHTSVCRGVTCWTPFTFRCLPVLVMKWCKHPD